MPIQARSTSDEPEPAAQWCAKPASSKQIAKWLELVIGSIPPSWAELRSIDVQRNSTSAKHVENSHYATDEPGLDRMAKDARGLTTRAAGTYFTLNPLKLNVSGRAANDNDILSRRWLLVDLDPVRPADMSATDTEKAEAEKVARRIQRQLAKKGWPGPIVADSGNGYHLLYRIDLPNDEASRLLVKRVLITLDRVFSTDLVKVDLTVFNASRICKVYGTLARKGEPTEDRPHRCSAIIDLPDGPLPVPPDLLYEAAAATPETKQPVAETNGHAQANGKAHKGAGLVARDKGDPVEAYSNEAVQAELNKISAAPTGQRNHQLFKSAAAIYQLVAAGTVDQVDADRELVDAARSLGLPESEIIKTLESARKAGTSQPRDMSKVGTKTTAKMPEVKDPETGKVEQLDDPHRLAREFLKACYSHPDGPTLCFWNDEWWAWYWKPKSWSVQGEKEIHGRLTEFIKREFDAATPDGKSPKGVGTRLLANVANALRGMVLLTKQDVREQPEWIDSPRPKPFECLPTMTGIVHLPTLMHNGPDAPGAVVAPTPLFFSSNSLDYGFDPNPPPPESWLSFLHDVWPEDPESIDCLQEWFGYLLTPDTRQQKILLMVGPKRSGKGTITRTLRALVGHNNVAAPTLSALASQFGCQGLIGKSVAVVPESRLTGRTDSQAIVERLLSISGEDPQSIMRKHKDDWNGTLRCRFVLLGNELPRLGDYSGALPSRLVLLKMTQSFLGREDQSLSGRLLKELPGILVWAIVGWQRLHDRGRFMQPKSGLEEIEEFERLTNPVGAFLAEKCEVCPDVSTPVSTLYGAWKSWCEENGKERPGDVQGFSRALRATVSSIETDRLQSGGTRSRIYRGVSLRGGDDAF